MNLKIPKLIRSMGDTNNSVPKSSGGAGNTKTAPPKQISPAKHWVFTLNNYTESEIDELLSIDSSKVPILLFQEEEEQTPHLQGALSFNTKGRPFNIVTNKRIHWEKKCRNATLLQSRLYCVDPDKRIKDGRVWMRGWRPPRPVKTLASSQLYLWETELLDIVKNEPDDRMIYWYWSEKGGVGKTSFCKYLVVHHDAIIVSGKSNDVKYAIREYTTKKGDTPNLIIWNIPRSFSMEYLNYEAIENVKDMLFFSSKYEGGMVCGNPPHLIIFANCIPNCDEEFLKRFIVQKID